MVYGTKLDLKSIFPILTEVLVVKKVFRSGKITTLGCS